MVFVGSSATLSGVEHNNEKSVFCSEGWFIDRLFIQIDKSKGLGMHLSYISLLKVDPGRDSHPVDDDGVSGLWI